MSFVIALIVTQMSIVEWRRNKNRMYKHLTLGFGLMFAQITVITAFLVYSFWSGRPVDESQVTVLEHMLLTCSYIYITAAFVTNKSSFKSRFIRANIFVLLFLSFILWSIWNISDTKPYLKFWSDLPFEIWNVGLLIYAVWSISRLRVRMRRGLVIATAFLLCKNIVHFLGVFASSHLQPVIPLIEHLNLVIFFYVIITTMHKGIIEDLLFMESEKNKYKEKAHQDTIRALINSLEAKDEYTRGHSDRVTEYAMVIGQRLGFDQNELTQLYYGAILHDIGKIGISEDILNNPLSLCRDQFDCIKKHPEIGANIVTSIEYLKNIAPSILHHHERYDGTGYPHGLKGKEIPLHARIISITDALDAMSSTRTYRRSLPEDKTIREIIEGSGTQFDPDLVKVLLDALGVDVKNFKITDLSLPA